MNKVILLGRLTADPELRQSQGGVASCRFTVATDRSYVNKETNKKEADFITCVAWGQKAEFVSKYFTKGKMISIEGELRNNNYKDKNHEDVMHYTTDVVVNNVEFAGDGKSASAPQTNNKDSAPIESAQNDDLPF